jgi:hypothetical protein
MMVQNRAFFTPCSWFGSLHVLRYYLNVTSLDDGCLVAIMVIV